MKHKIILLVEDDYLDVTSVKRSLAKLQVPHTLHVAHNGADALAVLNGTDNGEKVLPDIILLDLNMPKMNGLEFLSIIKNYYSLKNIKVYVMTTSDEEYDIVATQQLGVAGYILKPLDFDATGKGPFGESVASLKQELLRDDHSTLVPLFLSGSGKLKHVFTGKKIFFKNPATYFAKHVAGLKAFGLGAVALTSLCFIVKQQNDPPKHRQHTLIKALPARPATVETLTELKPAAQPLTPAAKANRKKIKLVTPQQKELVVDKPKTPGLRVSKVLPADTGNKKPGIAIGAGAIPGE